jgi:hypothetical protein
VNIFIDLRRSRLQTGTVTDIYYSIMEDRMGRPAYYLYLLLLLIAVAIGWGTAEATSFTGDLVMSMGEDTISGKIYVTDGFYRMDVKEHGDQFSIVVDRSAGLTRVFLPNQKQYIEIKSDGPVSRMSDPFQGLTFMSASGQERTVGIDSVSGYECLKRVLSMSGQDIITYWYATSLDFPIKIDNLVSAGTFAKINFISEGPIEEKIFAIPPGYSKMAAPGTEPPEIPDWASKVAKAPVVTPPFERSMVAGDIVRIKVQPGMSVWVRATDASDDAVAKAIPFKDGKPIKSVSMYSNFAQRGVICDRRNETAAEADEIVIRAFEGKMTVEAKSVAMQEKRVSQGESFSYGVSSQENIELRLVDVSDGPSECIWTWLIGGSPAPHERLGPIKQRTASFDDHQTVVRKTLSPIGDTLVINVTRGAVVVKLGQYDSFVW